MREWRKCDKDGSVAFPAGCPYASAPLDHRPKRSPDIPNAGRPGVDGTCTGVGRMRLKTGLVGTGLWGRMHALAYRTHPATELVAVCDQDETRCRAFAEEFGVA